MQNRTKFRTHLLVHLKQTSMFPHNNVAIKAPKCTKYVIKMYNIFIFLVSVQYFKPKPKHGSFAQPIAIKVCKCTKIWDKSL